MRLSSRLAVLTLACLFPLSAFANEPREHDEGFYLRLAPGFGSATSKVEEGGDSLEIGGAAGVFDVAVGMTVSPNFIVHANVGAFAVIDPTFKVNGVDFETTDVTFTLSMFGAGVTYYVGESNIFLSGSVGAASLGIEYEGESANSDLGLALQASVGKEWWVGDKWAIGVAGVVNYHSVNDSDVDEKWKGTSFGGQVTFTMN